MNAADQLLKSRDDKAPLILSSVNGEAEQFSLTSTSESAWIKSGETVNVGQMRARLEPWLTALFQSEHLSLLVGSGLSHGVHDIATGHPLLGMSSTPYVNYGAAIDLDAQRSAQVMGRQHGNLEDQFRSANELLRGLDILAATFPETKATAEALRKEIESKLHASPSRSLKERKA